MALTAGISPARRGAPPAQANAAGAAILVPGSECTFQTPEDYYQGAPPRARSCNPCAQSTAQPRSARLVAHRCAERSRPAPCSVHRPHGCAAEQRILRRWRHHGRRLRRQDPRADDHLYDRLGQLRVPLHGQADMHPVQRRAFHAPACRSTWCTEASMRSDTRSCGLLWWGPAPTLVRHTSCYCARARAPERLGAQTFCMRGCTGRWTSPRIAARATTPPTPRGSTSRPRSQPSRSCLP